MTESQLSTALWAAFTLLIHLALIVRAILRPRREPASRVAWVVVLLALPILGVVAYVLFGEVRFDRRRIARMREVLGGMPSLDWADSASAPEPQTPVPARYEQLFQVGRAVNGFPPVAGNRARLLADSNAAIDAIVSDIEAAQRTVHVLFYIWLVDNNGLKVVEALRRAAARGVACRAMVDGLGSRSMIGSIHWESLRASGVQVATAMPIGNPVMRGLFGRIDLRNHRKIVVIDGTITYCGSQNCSDPEFRIKPRYAPWVDAMVRFEGPIARQNQHLFVSDWMAQVDEDIRGLLTEPLGPVLEGGLTAQVIGTGPTMGYSAMPEVFESLAFAARRELVATTPYYVPDEAMHAALCAAARRGVETTIIFPARNDSFIVGAASRSYYGDLLEAGARVFEYDGGLLHTKSLVIDREVGLIGSANMDRRSFDLNYENNVLFYDPALSADLRRRQNEYLAESHAVTSEEVAAWPLTVRFRNNAIAMIGPVL